MNNQMDPNNYYRSTQALRQCDEPKLVDDNISSKLGELDASLNELLASSSRLANSLTGSIPETGAQVGPDSSDVLGKLSSLLRIARETNQQIERANRAVGN